jgi:DNA-binding transcriptional regulator YiaG
MDKRRKHIDREAERAFRESFYQSIDKNELSLPEAVKAMRKLSRLTISEFADHRGVSVPTLKQMESLRNKPNMKIETLNKVADIFGLEVGFVRKKKSPQP